MRSGSHIGNSWRSSGCRLDRHHRVAARDERGDRERSDRARSDDEGAIAVDQSRPGDAVQRHRQRLGQRRIAHRDAVGQGDQRALVEEDVRREGALVLVVGDVAAAVLALGRSALEAAPAPTALRRRSTDHLVADVPGPDIRSNRGDRAGPLVAAHVAGLAPPLHHHVEVGAADPAVAHRGEHLARAGSGDRAGLDHDVAHAPVDGHGHLIGQRRVGGHDTTSLAPNTERRISSRSGCPRCLTMPRSSTITSLASARARSTCCSTSSSAVPDERMRSRT